jgi:hypothetical protein
MSDVSLRCAITLAFPLASERKAVLVDVAPPHYTGAISSEELNPKEHKNSQFAVWGGCGI